MIKKILYIILICFLVTNCATKNEFQNISSVKNTKNNNANEQLKKSHELLRDAEFPDINS